MSLVAWIGVALLGGVGAVCRDLLERRTSLLAVNVVGSAVLGALSGVTGDARTLVGVGFLGALTSFSGWTLEGRARGVAHLLLGLAAAAAARALLAP